MHAIKRKKRKKKKRGKKKERKQKEQLPDSGNYLSLPLEDRITGA
jgi:hypothetical protein